MSKISMSASAVEDLFSKVKDNSMGQGALSTKTEDQGASKTFMDHLQEGLNEVNQMQKSADNQAVEVASGRSGNIHEAMIAASKAELSFNLMVQMRNKALEAYLEVMRMPV